MTARLDAVRRLLDTPPPEPVPGQTALDVPTAPRSAKPKPPPTCDTGNPVCGAPARLYPAGWRCDRHRPSSYHPQ
ncbi:aromatic ring-opening dioxygenase LigA [Streptomyces sp. LB8]|uniref:aromatic ring-opening dioxygenase LigA n=1 Tax=Streptomyces sp. LB8 TaxID=3042509 RepID=UPI002648B6E2|nr:aromatic ring-opening dioxygenase LigA [Streptomyces sp. LB8]MDN5380702.1 aromatic ring-opening dioxygenase LigA [Streptomyces sp. LB8]